VTKMLGFGKNKVHQFESSCCIENSEDEKEGRKNAIS